MNEPINELKQDNADEQYQTYLRAKKYFDILCLGNPVKRKIIEEAIAEYERTHADR